MDNPFQIEDDQSIITDKFDQNMEETTYIFTWISDALVKKTQQRPSAS